MSALSDLFQDIADAIRTKTGGTAKLAPAAFPAAIAAIEGGGSGVVDILPETELVNTDAGNGVYSLSFTEQFELTAGETYIVEFAGVEYTCEAATATLGTLVGVGIGNPALVGLGDDTGEPFLIGVPTDGSGAQGYTTLSDSPITVRIYAKSSGGSVSLPAGVYFNNTGIVPPSAMAQKWVSFNGALYVIASVSSSDYSTWMIYRRDSDAWTTVVSSFKGIGYVQKSDCITIEYNGKLHIFARGGKYHYIFDGATLTTASEVSEYVYGAFVVNDTLFITGSTDATRCTWDEAADSWESNSSLLATDLVVVNDKIYYYKNTKQDDGTYKKILFRLEEDGSSTSYMVLSNALFSDNILFTQNNCVYAVATSTTKATIRKIDLTACTESEVGGWLSTGSGSVYSTYIHNGAFYFTYGYINYWHTNLKVTIVE